MYFGQESIEELLSFLIEESYSQVFVLVDEHTEAHCLPLLQKTLFDTKVIKLQSGEVNKNLQSLQLIWDKLLANRADRNSVLINLGGGVIGDIGGFAAATFKRGIDFIHVPTTLLAMVDSAIGGKLAIDYGEVKNAIGLIKNPKAVFINPNFVTTQPETEIKNAFAEMLKHGLIADEDYWQKLKKIKQVGFEKLLPFIHGSVKIKSQVVKKDPSEKDLRKILNFGHTIGHAIESYSLEHDSTPLKHGHSVAIGMICEAHLSMELAGFGKWELNEISEVIMAHFPKYSLRNILSPELIRIMLNDKKNTQAGINFSLLKRIGKAGINYTANQQQITNALNYYDSL